MANKEKIDYLLLDIRELENLVASMRDAEIYPVSFFSQTFELSHKIIQDLHSLETNQIESLRKQMEEHQRLIQSIPRPEPIPQPVIVDEPIVSISKEIIMETPVEPEPIQETSVPEQENEQILPEEPVAVKSVTPEVSAPAKSFLGDKSGISFNEVLEKQNLSDFRKAFSLNDRFRFRRELFGGDEARMNQAITDLNEIHSYEDSVAYLYNELKWNVENPEVADFIKLLEKRFL